MRCETCGPDGMIPRYLRMPLGARTPCPDCGGFKVVHCCDGLTAANDPIGKDRPDANQQIDRKE